MILEISVIVPIYNVEFYLCRCLDSLVNQTLRNIEIICINDSSPDNSLAILKKYAEKDNRIKIIDFEKNQGVNAARNSGMKIAKGEYIGFCDPDDYVDLDFYEKLYELAKNKNADIVYGNAKILNYLAKEETIAYEKSKRFSLRCFWTGIYRKTMLKKHSIKFPTNNIIIGGDNIFLVHATTVTEKIVFLDNPYYHYIRRNDSLANIILSREKCHSLLFCIALTLRRLNISKVGKFRYCYAYKLYLLSTINLVSRVSDISMIKEITKSIIKFYKKYKFPINMNLSENIPKSIIAALKKKNEKELFSLLLEWKNNEYYPKINIKESILQNRELYIWGTGADSSKTLIQCKRNNWKISAFLDSNKDIKEFNGYKVKRPEQILNKARRNFFIIISSRKYGKEMAKSCKYYGLKKGVDFWKPY